MIESLLANVPDHIYFKDKEGRYLRASRSLSDFLRINMSDVVGRTDADLFPPDIAVESAQLERIVMDTGVPLIAKEESARVHGARHWVSTTKVPWRSESGSVIGILGISRVITKRKEAEEQLRQSRERLRDLTVHLQMQREQELSGLAREIHDTLIQSLAAIKMDISALGRHTLNGSREAAEVLGSMNSLVDETIQTARSLCFELRPSELDDLGLCAAVRGYVESFEKRSGIKCDLSLSCEPDSETTERSTAVYRVLQEALSNVALHAEASKVTVILKDASDTLELEIADDGKGIDPDRQRDPLEFGITGIKEQVRSLGGTISITGTPGKGTTVRVSLRFTGDRREW